MNTDPIADLLTRIRNGHLAGHAMVEIPYSRLKERILEVLQQEGYIRRYELRDDKDASRKALRVLLKYDQLGEPVIRHISRTSKPGRRVYQKSVNLPRILRGAGIAIVTTSKGVMTDRQARRENIGGEVLCAVY